MTFRVHTFRAEGTPEIGDYVIVRLAGSGVIGGKILDEICHCGARFLTMKLEDGRVHTVNADRFIRRIR